MNAILNTLLLALLISSVRASVLLTDPDNICSETNGGSHVVPGMVVTLVCDVNNTGANINLLIWNTQVNGQSDDLIHTTTDLSESNSIFSSTATFNGNLVNATLIFTTNQSLDNQVVTCRDSLGNSKTCTLLIYSELFNFVYPLFCLLYSCTQCCNRTHQYQCYILVSTFIMECSQ